MVDIKIMYAEPHHLQLMMGQFRQIDKDTAMRLGLEVEDILPKLYNASIWSKIALADDKLAAIWGCCEGLDGMGLPWLYLTEVAEKFPYRVASFYRKELQEMLHSFKVLVDISDSKEPKALRMLKIAGFTFGETIPMGKNNELFIRAEKR